MAKIRFDNTRLLRSTDSFASDLTDQLTPEQLEQIGLEEDRQAAIIDRRIADGSLVVPFKRIKSLPRGFQPVGIQTVYTTVHIAMQYGYRGLKVICRLEIHEDRVWQRVILIRYDRFPTTAEIEKVKEKWIGSDKDGNQRPTYDSPFTTIDSSDLTPTDSSDLTPTDSSDLAPAPISKIVEIWACLDPFP
jgi:hypothetical protein